MTESLKQKTAKGLFWGAMNSGSTQILNLIFGIVLGRMLSPEIYSVVAILTIFVAIAGDLQSS
ncbi:MAG: lipopolysaccharide biosynthesis protein, partial [Prevotella sp.]